jgi:hypothetical protein
MHPHPRRLGIVPPPASEPDATLCIIKGKQLTYSGFRMPTLDRNVAEQIAECSALEYTFGNVYHFILGAVGGDAAVAKAMFERYLAGELSEELLTISRQCVRADRKGARVEQDWANRESKAAANGCVSNAFNAIL